jgi:hypothetical protein
MQNQHSRHFLFLFLHVRALSLTVVQAVAQIEAEAKAKAEEAAAILKDNSNATDVFISDVKGINPKIIGLYSPTQETGRDGRIVYRKCDASDTLFEKFCIEHCEGDWQVKHEHDILMAYVRGGGALEDCCLQEWHVWDGRNFTIQHNVKIATGQKARFKASVGCSFEPECRINTVATFFLFFTRVHRP